MTGLHREKQGAQHPETDSSVEGGVYGALTVKRRRPVRSFRELEGDSHEGLLLAGSCLSLPAALVVHCQHAGQIQCK